MVPLPELHVVGVVVFAKRLPNKTIPCLVLVEQVSAVRPTPSDRENKQGVARYQPCTA